MSIKIAVRGFSTMLADFGLALTSPFNRRASDGLKLFDMLLPGAENLARSNYVPDFMSLVRLTTRIYPLFPER